MEAYERKEVENVAQDAQEIIEGVGKWNERGMEQESNGLEGMSQENIDRGEVSRYDEIEGSDDFIVEDLDELLNDPKILSGISGETLYDYLVKNGYEVKPLSKGSLKGIPFEDGGGFKVNWGGDRILQYHPDKLSHHGGGYFKISSGKTGTVRIDLDGNLIE